MNNQNYLRTIVVPATPEAAFDAIARRFPDWWAEADGTATAVGDQVTVHFDPTWWKMEVSELVHPSVVEYRCIEANHCHPGIADVIKEEWLGTRLRWTIQRSDVGSQIIFEHIGLTPQLNCYEVCEEGWDHFFVGSLKAFLDTRKGTPGAD